MYWFMNPEKELLTTYIDETKVVEKYADPEEPLNADWNFTIGGCWAQWDWFTDKSVTKESFIGAVDEFKVFNKAVYNMDYIVNAVPAVATPTTPSDIVSSTTESSTVTDTSSTNSQTTSANSSSKNVETGDHSPIAMAALLMAAVGAVLVCRKKSK